MADFLGLFGQAFDEEEYLNADDEAMDEPMSKPKMKSSSNTCGHQSKRSSSSNDNIFDLNQPNNSDNLPDFLPPECADGNIEYKLKLINPSASRFEHLVTQMKWRLREGSGEAIYELGVEDKGMLVGLREEEARSSLETLCLMSKKLGASLTILRERFIEPRSDELAEDGFVEAPPRKAMEVLIRKVPDDQESVELRVAVLGNVDVGKSTLLGVLTQGELDNGRGSARLNLFRHRHEVQSGRTSSISREILGFSAEGTPLTYSTYRSAEEICEDSSKIITFIDLAGHHKYLSTTVFGLMGHLPHFTLLLVSAVSGIAGTTKEHLSLSTALELPIVIVVNKIDLANESKLEETVAELESFLKSNVVNRVPLRITCHDDVLTAATNVSEAKIVPVFFVSSVTGIGLPFLYTFFNVLPPRLSPRDRELLIQMDPEFQVDETFHVPNVGSVVGGLLVSGSVRSGEVMSVGPFKDGAFLPFKISSVHRHKVPCRLVRAGESATLALVPVNEEDRHLTLRKGMVIVPIMKGNEPSPACLYFQARVHVLYHHGTISQGFKGMVHVGNIRQSAVVVGIMGRKGITMNESASVMFKFLKNPELIRTGSRLLFRESSSKAIGRVIQSFPIGSWLEH